MVDRIHIQLSPYICVTECSDKQIVFVSAVFKWTLHRPLNCLKKCVQLLISQKKTRYALYDDCISLEQEADSFSFNFFSFLEKLKKQALLSYSVFEKEALLATLIQTQAGFILKNTFIEDLEFFQLSRFAYLRQREGKFVLETPLFPAEIIIENANCLNVLRALTQPKRIGALFEEVEDISKESLADFLSLLLMGFFLDTGEDSSLVTWEFHDLLFHTRSRRGRHNVPSGGTFRFLGKRDPLPLLHLASSFSLAEISLFCPDMERLNREDIPFSRVLENRKSIRNEAFAVIEIEQLGEFLYRSARIKRREPLLHYEISYRPTAGGGACHELELYLVIYRCAGIEPGLYYYHPEKHALLRKEVWNQEIQALLQEAQISTKKKELPQVLIVITARFARVSWKYQSIAYSVILKNTGALIQTMYLVATAMGLAPCAIGCGNADRFSRLIRSDYYEESSVGEFLLGGLVS